MTSYYPPIRPVRTPLLLAPLALASLAEVPAASAQEPVVFQLQGSADEIDGFDETHSGRAANFFQASGDETGIYAIASDWVGGHNPDFIGPWPAPDGLVQWSYWDPAGHGPERRGPEVVNAAGQVVYRNPAGGFSFHNDDASAPVDQEKLYHLADDRFVTTLSFGNEGTPSGAIADRQYVTLAEYDLAGAHDAGFSGSDLLGATFTIWIDDVINMDLITTDGRLPSQAFVNVYAGDGDLANVGAIQAKFDTSDASTAADVQSLTWDDPALGPMRLTDFALARSRSAALADIFDTEFFPNGLPIEFDVTDELAGLLDADAPFAGITLAGSSDGDFTLGSIDNAVIDTDGETVLQNFLPMLTLEFADVVSPLAGDYTGDGAVQQEDLDLVLTNWGVDLNANGFPEAWVNFRDFDGGVAQAQLDAVLLNWGSSAAPSFGSNAVPEPGVAAALAGGLGLLVRRCRSAG